MLHVWKHIEPTFAKTKLVRAVFPLSTRLTPTSIVTSGCNHHRTALKSYKIRMTSAIELFDRHRWVHADTSFHCNLTFLCLIQDPCTPAKSDCRNFWALSSNFFTCVRHHSYHFINRVSAYPTWNCEHQFPILYDRVSFVPIWKDNSESLFSEKVTTSFGASLMHTVDIVDNQNSQFCIGRPNSINCNIFTIKFPAFHLTFRLSVVWSCSSMRTLWTTW